MLSLNERQIGIVARACHEANREYCAYLGDDSQVVWDEAPEWQKSSARLGVIFHLENPDAQACHSHECWLREKEAQGWKYGPVKDAEKKEHPCFVPYSELPDEQKFKDTLFMIIIKLFHALFTDENDLLGREKDE